METTRIKVKIGTAEFDGEGPASLIQEQLRAFMDAVSKQPAAITETETPRETGKEKPAAAAPITPKGTPKNSLELTPEQLGRVYRDDDLLSLIAIPRGETAKVDGLLMLIYGYELLKGQPTVTAGTLMQAARQTGLVIDRIDRTMAMREELVNTAGIKKGRKYTLNNKGKQYVVDLIHSLL